MSNPVRVVADINGNVIQLSKNKEYGYVRVVQDIEEYTEDGFIRDRTLSALIHGTVEKLVSKKWEDGTELPGRIIIKEQHNAFDEEDGDRDLKRAGATGVICRVDDEPIYRRTFYSEDPNAQHQLIRHNNSDEIKAASKEMTRNLKKISKNMFEVARF